MPVLPIWLFFLRRDMNNSKPVPINATLPPPIANALSSRKLGAGAGGGASFLGKSGFASSGFAAAAMSVFGGSDFVSADFKSALGGSLVASLAATVAATGGVTCATLMSGGGTGSGVAGAGLASNFAGALSSGLAAIFISAGAPRPFTSASFFMVVICFSKSDTRELASFSAFSRTIFSSLSAFS